MSFPFAGGVLKHLTWFWFHLYQWNTAAIEFCIQSITSVRSEFGLQVYSYLKPYKLDQSRQADAIPA